MKKVYRGDCVSNPFRSASELNKVIDNAREITKETFLRNVDGINQMKMYGSSLRELMKKYPNDFKYYSYKGRIYFFEHSAIEYFFW